MRNGRSVAQQEAECRRQIEDEAWDLVGVWVDNDRGASQWSKGKREQWEDLKDQVTAGDIDVLVVWEPSRLTRDRLVWAALAAICEREGVKIAASGRLYDLSDPDDAFQLDLYFALATREVGVTRKRVMRDAKAQAEAGHPHGGIAYGYYRLYDETTGNLIKQLPDYRPRLNLWGVNFVLWLAIIGRPDQWCTPLGLWALGYRVWEESLVTGEAKSKHRPPWWALGPLFTPDDHRIEWYTRADIVTDVIVPRALAGDPEFAITRELGRRGILTSTGSLFEPPTLRYLLSNPTYAGYRRYQGQLYPAKWAPLIRLEDHQALTVKYGRRIWEGKKTPSVSREHTVKYLLSGLLACGVCDGPCNVTSAAGPGQRRYYTCIGRGKIPGRGNCTARPMAEIDLYVTELVIEWLSSPEAAEVLMADTRSAVDLRNLMDRREEVTERLRNLFKNAGLNGMSDELLAQTERNLKGQLETLNEQIDARQPYPVLRDLVKPERADVEAAWDRLADNLPRRREVVRTLFTRLELQRLGRGRRGVPVEQTIKVTWRNFQQSA